jgi:hypothetical protein
MSYLPRKLEYAVQKYLKLFPVVGLSGPRQSGKSSLLKNNFLDSYKYITFDDYTTIELFHHDPENFIRVNQNKVIFDEVHKVPEIFNYIKIAVDNDRQNYGKFILTGSAQFILMQNISESLAGRIGLLTLLPFEFGEMPESLLNESIIKGSYPELVTRDYLGYEEWFGSYLETYLQKDLRTIGNVGDIRDFRRLIQLLAARTAQLLNISELSKEIGVAVSTIKKWISILEASYIIFLLPPYYNNLGKRVIKAPKIFFYDTGLVSFLTGIKSKEHYENGPMRGSLFENYIVSEILKREKHSDSKAELYFMRTNHGVEIDLIIDRKSFQELIEIKCTETFKPLIARGIETLMTNENQTGLVLYSGVDLEFSEKIKVVNYKNYFNSN